ncbi:MAG: PTS transporter subunit EIIC [Faecalicoccus sp.]|uniref:PTS sugar transporter subunit IIC n=1 Tax=Faecalicoccus sp. TaxID=1971758 RepID=UPI002F92703E
MIGKLEKFLLPLANKLSMNRYLSAIRDGFIAIMPLMIVGSFFILINNVFIGENGLTAKLFNLPLLELTELGNAIVPATMSVMSVLLTFTTAKALCETYKEDTTITPIIAVVTLFILMPISTNADLGIEIINTQYTGAAAIFMAFISAICTVEIIRKLSTFDKIIIKMPDSVPPSIARSFNKLIPVMLTIIIFGIVRYFTDLAGSPLNDLIFKFIQTPFTNIVSSPVGLVIIYILYMLLWGLGIHSAFIFGPILEPIYLATLTANSAALQSGAQMTGIITKPFVDSVAFMGGAGNMFALLIAILLVSKRSDYKTIAKLGFAPAIFNISEPLMFGLPVVMNPILIIPMILSTLSGLLIGTISTVLGFMGYTYVLVPWVTPPVVNSFLSSGGSIGAAITVVIIFVVSVLIYIPFVKIADKQIQNEQ